MRKYLYHTLSGVLFLLLIVAAWSTAATMTLGKPTRVEHWLAESGLYDNFVDNAIEQSQNPTTGETSTIIAGVPLSDPNVQQAAKAAFTPGTVQKAVNTFLDANYAWLQGKTKQPQFTIDLTQAKAVLATNLGNYAAKRATTLPRCTTLAEVHQAAQDYLAATCIPVTVSPARVGTAVKDDVATSPDFLANPVITARTFSASTLKGSQQNASPSQPYYQKLSSLPTAYRLATMLPWILFILMLLGIAGVVLLAASKRAGLLRVARLCIFAGAIVLLLIIITGMIFNHLENVAFTTSRVGQLQQSLVDFADRARAALNNLDLRFGLGFILIGAVLYVCLKYIWPDRTATPRPATVQMDTTATSEKL